MTTFHPVRLDDGTWATAPNLARMKGGSLFSGYGGLDMAVNKALGVDTVWHSDIDLAASRILAHHWPDVPNLGDIADVDWQTVEPVDILTGGFPCQDVSMAGKRAGIRPGTRSGLWEHMAYAVAQLRPRLVIIENVRGLLSADAHSDLEPCPWCLGDGHDVTPMRALGAVLGDLAVLGYDARWRGVRAADVGAPHGRFRIFIAAADARREHGQRRAVEVAGGAGEPLKADRPQQPAEDAATHPQGDGRDEGRTKPARLERRPNAAERGTCTAPDADRAGRIRQGTPRTQLHNGDRQTAGRNDPPTTPDTDSTSGETRERRPRTGDPGRLQPVGDSDTDWREYGPAIARWEHILGRPAPCPHQPGTRGNRRLNPSFVEWLMGLPAGHVCAVPGISRNDQLRALGNGVVPQQAALALRLLQADKAAA